MRVFKTRYFARYACKENISDSTLIKAVKEIENGIVGAVLGGGIIKKRIPREGSGKRGGYRTLIAYKASDRSLFLLGFAKNEKENIDKDDLSDLKEVSKDFLSADIFSIEKSLQAGDIEEIPYG